MDTSPLNKLVDCAKAIEGGNLNDADLLLKEIIASNESLSRATKSLVKYYAEALVRRLYKLYPRNLTPLIPSGTDRLPETDYPFSPFFCFGDFTTLDPVRDAIKGKRRVHIIEFGIVVSFWRYYDLFRDVSRQSTGPISFRLTFVGPVLSIAADHTQKTLERLHGEAERFAIDFEVRHLVANSAADIVDSVLKLTRASGDETIVVKWKFQLHKLLTLTGASEKVLSKLRELKPEIMIIVEQEASHNGQNLLDCFSKSFQYYSIVFDSLDKDNVDINSDGVRRKVFWEMSFRRQICKLVAPGGTDHVERHETFAYWQDRLRRFGFRHYRFKPQSFSNFCREQMPEYSWEEKDRHPQLRRKGIPLVFSSAWKPDPTQLNCGSSMELDEENYSKFHENQPDDPHIMTQEIMWSEKDVGDQNSTFEAASTGITSILQQKSRNSWKDFSEQLSGANFSSEIRIENFETSDVRPAGISDSYYSLNSSEVRKFCNISNPTSDGVEVQEAHDQEMGEQNSTCGAASNEITSTLQKNPWKSWKDHSSEFMELCNISNPASDGEEVQEARDQEVEEQEFAFVPEAPSPDNEEGGRGTSRLNASARNKRRRTSEVWQYFEEVRENGEIWAKCKSCSTRYRGESTRGTTNLHKHLKSCAGKK